MLIDKDSVKQIFQSAMDQVEALPDMSGGDQQAEIDALKAEVEQKKGEIDALNVQVSDLQGKLQADESKIEKAKEDLA